MLFKIYLLNPDLPPEAYEQVIKLYGLDKPLSERVFLIRIGNFLQGDFGYSYKHYPKTPIELICTKAYLVRLMLFAMVNIIAFYTGFLNWKNISLEKRI